MSEKQGKKQTKALKLTYEEPKNYNAARRAVIKSIAKKHGAESVGVIRNKIFIKSSSIRFNWVTGGGWCLGRIYELSGRYSSGKTTWALDAIANAQKQFPQKAAAFVDVEETFDTKWAKNFGVDPKMLDMYRPPNAQAMFDQLYDICSSGAYSLAVVDSLAAAIPIEELLVDVAAAKDKMGVFARVVSTGLKKLLKVAADSRTCIIFINQLRDTMAMYGPKTTTPGGNAMKHYASCRIQVSVKSGSEYKDEDQLIGHTLKLFVEKNKLGPPKRTTEIDLFFGKPFDSVTELRALAIEEEILVRDKKKGGYVLNGKIIAPDLDVLNKLLTDNYEMRMKLYEAVDKAVNPIEDSETSKEFEEIIGDAPDRVEADELIDFEDDEEKASGEEDENL